MFEGNFFDAKTEELRKERQNRLTVWPGQFIENINDQDT